MNNRRVSLYVLLLAGCLASALVTGWLFPQFDNIIYNHLFRLYSPPRPALNSVILGIDEESFRGNKGVRGIRGILCDGLMRMADAAPRAVVVDLILAEEIDADDDACLEDAFAKTKNLILAADMPKGRWEEPVERFRKSAVAVGHVHSDPDFFDSIVRQISLEKAAGQKRYWALALEAYRVANGVEITEDPAGLEAGSLRIAGRQKDGVPMRVRYLRPPEGQSSAFPQISFAELKNDPGARERLRGKIVFIGITADSGAQDRHMTPYSFGRMMPGVEIHANAYETLANGWFLRDASDTSVVAFATLLCGAAGLAFWRFAGLAAYALAGAVLLFAHFAPFWAFRSGIVFPYAPPFFSAWFSVAAAGAYQYFFTRRVLTRTEAERERYQGAIHWAVHEMRTPLTAIQGSSELMGRYKLPDEKKSEIARMINTESKRLARMIQAFLDVERLSAGQMDLKREPFHVVDVVDICLDRVQPLAEKKRILLNRGDIAHAVVTGDRELMEYAVYNLLTNAIKYSPAETEVLLTSLLSQGKLRLSVQDQGIGMDQQEIKNLGKKFYRTKKAEASGEAGTGIGLSIVEQIVGHHGGKMEVTSSPGAGSCFTIVVPASVPSAGD